MVFIYVPTLHYLFSTCIAYKKMLERERELLTALQWVNTIVLNEKRRHYIVGLKWKKIVEKNTKTGIDFSHWSIIF